MIERLTLHNLKRFRDASFAFANLTVLTGANGGGKSSLLQAVLLARQVAATSPTPSSVSLNGPYELALGEALDVLSADADDDQIVVTVSDEGVESKYVFGVSDDRSLLLRVVNAPGMHAPTLCGRGPAFTYLSAERLGPRDVLPVEASDENEVGLGARGEHCAQVLAVLERDEVRERLLHPETAARGGVVTLGTQTEYWLGSIVRPLEYNAQWLPNSSVAILRFKSPGVRTDWMRPSNVGFGVSYALPVIVAALLAPRGGLLLVENPEAHLQPAGQSRLAGLLARCAGAGVQVIIETHSDHVLNGIRAAIADERVLEASHAVIHFFPESDALSSESEEIHLTPKAALDRWPPGFFDQSEIDLARIARAKRN